MSQPPTPSPPWVLELKPYVPGKPIDELERELGITGSIKLASNENPLGPSPMAVEAVREAAGTLNSYPDPGTFALRARLAEHTGVAADRIVVGNGSNELITMLVRAFSTRQTSAVIGEQAFIAYRVCLGAAGARAIAVEMPGFRHDLPAMAEACEADTTLCFVANPNNPTGTYNTADEVRAFLRAVPDHVLVVLDEAYNEYVDADDWVPGTELLAERDNLVLLRTFAKAYGLAGSRVGYAVVPPYVADRLNRIREPFNVNALGQVAARAALDDTEHIARTVETNRRVRAALYAGLDELGVGYVPSQTNFVLVEAPGGGQALYDALLREGVIIRPLGPYGMRDHVRISVGNDDENARLLVTLRKVLGR